MLEPWAIQFRGVKKKLAWRAYQFGDLQAASLLHATSAAEAGNLQKLGLTSPVVVAPNGVDADAMPCATHDPRRTERVLLFLSRIHPKKGLLDLVTAWSRVRPPGWTIRIVGADEDNHLRDVRGAVEHAGLSAVVHFTDHVNGAEKWEAYKNSDVFALPSYSENFGLVVAEALGCGLPVITTQATPWSELVDADCGWWVPTGPDAFEQALRAAVLLSPAERMAMGLRGRALIRERYTWPAIARLMINGYETVLNPVVA
jgi:glycosyltransferase involved in cell wall biosynthesis